MLGAAAELSSFAPYARPGGWRGAVGLYRSMLSEGDEIRALAASRPLVPVLAVGAGGGPFTAQTLAQAINGEMTSVQLKGVGHYAAPEAPQALSAVILDFWDGIDAISEGGS